MALFLGLGDDRVDRKVNIKGTLVGNRQARILSEIGIVDRLHGDKAERINLLGTEKITKTWKGGNSHVKYEKNRTNSPL